MKPITIPFAVLAGAFLPLVCADTDPFSTDPQGTGKTPPVAKNQALVNYEVRYEAFSLPLADAARLKREGHVDSKLYARILDMVADGEAKQETFSMVRVRSGEKATGEAISEQIYPTEYEPPELSNVVGVQIANARDEAAPAGGGDAGAPDEAPGVDLRDLATPSTPTAFETRNVGLTLGLELSADQGARLIHLRVAPDHVTRTGDSVHGQGLSEAKMPEFETQRLNLSQVCMAGVPRLLGTISRPPVSKVDPDSAKTTWYAFVTARPVAVK